MSIYRIGIVFLGWLLCSSYSAYADYIQMQVTTTTAVDARTAHFTITIKNLGNTPALQVTPHLLIGDKTQTLNSADRLGPQESYEISYEIQEHPFKKGIYHLPLYIDYQDLNRAPFQATHLVQVRNSTEVMDSGLVIKIPNQTLVDEQQAELTVYNAKNVQRTLSIHKVVPSALLLMRLPDEVVIGPTSKVTLPVVIVNKNALPSSQYIIMIVFSDEH